MLTRGSSSGEYHAPSSRTGKTGLRSKFSRFSSGDVRNGFDSSPQLRDLRTKSGGSSGKISSRTTHNRSLRRDPEDVTAPRTVPVDRRSTLLSPSARMTTRPSFTTASTCTWTWRCSTAQRGRGFAWRSSVQW